MNRESGSIAQLADYQSNWVGKTHVTFGSDHSRFGFDQGVFTPGETGVRGSSPYEHFRNVKDPDFWNSDSFLWSPEIMLANDPYHSGKSLAWEETAISDFGPDIELEKIFDFMEQSQAQGEPSFVYHTSHLGHQAVDMLDPKFSMTWPGTPKITWDPATESYTRHQPRNAPKSPVNTAGTSYEKENITPNTLKSHIEYLEKLEEMDVLDHTIIIFTADNGSKGWKASVRKQRGVHVPFVVYAPGVKGLPRGE